MTELDHVKLEIKSYIDDKIKSYGFALSATELQEAAMEMINQNFMSVHLIKSAIDSYIVHENSEITYVTNFKELFEKLKKIA
jgi:hypothetical protein